MRYKSRIHAKIAFSFSFLDCHASKNFKNTSIHVLNCMSVD